VLEAINAVSRWMINQFHFTSVHLNSFFLMQKNYGRWVGISLDLRGGYGWLHDQLRVSFHICHEALRPIVTLPFTGGSALPIKKCLKIMPFLLLGDRDGNNYGQASGFGKWDIYQVIPY
jgi:hypothetical protein